MGIVQPGASGAGYSEASWIDPQPLPNDLPPVMDLDSAMLPDTFRGWIVDAADRMQTPPDYHAAACVVAASSLIGRRCGIYPKRVDNWFVIPNLWGGVVGRPGTLKSPAIKAGLKPLYALEREAIEENETDLKAFALSKEIHEAQKAAFKKRIQDAANKGNSLDGLRHEAPADLEEPKARRYISNDPTVAKMGELLRDNPNGLFLFRDELTGWLRSLDRPEGKSDRPFYLESWTGDQSYNVDRIGRGSIHIPAVCLSIFGGIQRRGRRWTLAAVSGFGIPRRSTGMAERGPAPRLRSMGPGGKRLPAVEQSSLVSRGGRQSLRSEIHGGSARNL
jgi:putative DNA primase/helicase